MVADIRHERTPLLNGASSQQINGNGNGNGTITSSPNGTANGHGHGHGHGHDQSPTTKDNDDVKKSSSSSSSSWLTRVIGPVNTVKVLFAGFLISLAFSFTQVSIFYVFHLMECDIYYESHPPYTGDGDRCSVNEVAARTATQFSILGMSTTFCGTLNLFVTGWTVKRWGPRFALFLQTLIPAIRTCCQIIGILAGGEACITIIQTTQLITVLGGPVGYILVVNTIAGELVEPVQRTAVFGQLQGCIMLGQAIGLFLGGYVGDTYGIRMPFNVAFFLLLTSSVYAGLVLPYISPESLSDGKKGAGRKGVSGFFAPLKIMAAQRVRYAGGRVGKHYGVFFLCWGIFFGVLATGYAPLLIQMYATAYFDFSQGDNGWLMSGNALMRSFFLFFIFPHIISGGRKWWVARERKSAGDTHKPAVSIPPKRPSNHDDDRNTLARIPSRPEEIEAPMAGNRADQEEPTQSPPQSEDRPEEERAACRFDLFFLRWSLLVDGLLTIGAALCTSKWQIFLAAYLLPFGSGSAPAGKGVITEMCSHSQRTDALNAVTLVENIARLATQGLFGFVFSALAETGQAYLTFYVTAAVAMVGMAVLYLSHFPPLDATMVEGEGQGVDDDDDDDGDDACGDGNGDQGDEDEDDGEDFVDRNGLARVVSHENDR